MCEHWPRTCWAWPRCRPPCASRSGGQIIEALLLDPQARARQVGEQLGHRHCVVAPGRRIEERARVDAGLRVVPVLLEEALHPGAQVERRGGPADGKRIGERSRISQIGDADRDPAAQPAHHVEAAREVPDDSDGLAERALHDREDAVSGLGAQLGLVGEKKNCKGHRRAEEDAEDSQRKGLFPDF